MPKGLYILVLYCFIYELQGVPKNGLFLRVDNFATVNGRKACDRSIVSKFCLEKKYKTCMSVHLNFVTIYQEENFGLFTLRWQRRTYSVILTKRGDEPQCVLCTITANTEAVD